MNACHASGTRSLNPMGEVGGFVGNAGPSAAKGWRHRDARSRAGVDSVSAPTTA